MHSSDSTKKYHSEPIIRKLVLSPVFAKRVFAASAMDEIEKGAQQTATNKERQIYFASATTLVALLSVPVALILLGMMMLGAFLTHSFVWFLVVMPVVLAAKGMIFVLRYKTEQCERSLELVQLTVWPWIILLSVGMLMDLFFISVMSAPHQ